MSRGFLSEEFSNDVAQRNNVQPRKNKNTEDIDDAKLYVSGATGRPYKKFGLKDLT